MNRPQRAAYSIADLTVDTSSEKISETTLGRIVHAEFSRFEAATKVRAPSSANGDLLFTDFSAHKEIAMDLGAIALAKDSLRSAQRNEGLSKARPITFSPEIEWEGCIVEIAGDHIKADLTNLTAREKRPSSTVEIPFTELDTADLPRLREGILFRWAIGYLRTSGGTKMRGSKIVFRHLPQWTRNDVAKAKRQAAECRNISLSRLTDEPSARPPFARRS